MNCQEIDREEIIEQYVAGTLPDTQRDELEEHYFGCEVCFRTVEACRAARAVLREDQDSIRAERRVIPFPRRYWPMTALVAAGLVVALFITFHRKAPEPAIARSPAPPAPVQSRPDPLVAMARFDPPAYQTALMRDAGSEAQSLFRAAMQKYSAGKYDEAIPGLVRAAGKDKDPEDAAIRFFLGVSYLLAGQTDNGVSALQKLAAAGDSPFLNEAWFYLGKAYLGRHDVAGARTALEHVVTLQRDLAPEAQALLNQLSGIK